MGIKGTDHKVTVSNEYCHDSLELFICKAVIIDTPQGTIELLQKNIEIKLKDQVITINPGEYPPPCKRSSLSNAEIFSEGVFTIVRVFSRQDPFKPLYEVGLRVSVFLRDVAIVLPSSLSNGLTVWRSRIMCSPWISFSVFPCTTPIPIHLFI